LVEGLSGLDLGPFGEVPLLKKAVHLRSDLRDEIRGSAARQLRGEQYSLRLYRNHGHLRRRRFRRLLLVFAAHDEQTCR
jgi:hypothetical protein